MKKITMQISSVFLKKHVLQYLHNFLTHYEGEISDKCFFTPFRTECLVDDTQAFIESVYSSEEIKKITSSQYRCMRFEGGLEDVFINIYNNRQFCEKLQNALCLTLDKKIKTLPQLNDDVFFERFNTIQKMFHLSSNDISIVMISYFFYARILERDVISQSRNESIRLKTYACYSGLSENTLAQAIKEGAPLRKYLCVDEDMDLYSSLYNYLKGTSNTPLLETYFTPIKDEPLPWKFFEEINAQHGDLLRHILLTSSPKKSPQILFYGLPGTGKSSFAQTLARAVGKNAYIIAQNEIIDNRSKKNECSRDFRFAALQICDEQINSQESIIIIDEADEILSRSGKNHFSMLFGGISGENSSKKGMLNKILDTIKTPCIWITNTQHSEIDSSNRRRFDYSIRFDKLSVTQREKIWCNSVQKRQLEHLISAEYCALFAEKYDVSAGGISLALDNIERLKPKKDTVQSLVEKIMTPHCTLMGISDSKKEWIGKDYSLQGLNIKSKIKLEQLVESVRYFQKESQLHTHSGHDIPRMNILLYGPPGTGKTEFVKYLATTLKSKLHIRMGSDILDKYVGGTEEKISHIFREAHAEKAILFLDEIDGLLQTREKAQHAWEVSQVNQLLYQMENFQGILVAATNFSANIDTASLRRFTYKIEFDFLDPAGKKHFFEHFFQMTLSENFLSHLSEIKNLSIGDFRTVRQSFYYLKNTLSEQDYIEALEHESSLKQSSKFVQKSIGF